MCLHFTSSRYSGYVQVLKLWTHYIRWSKYKFTPIAISGYLMSMYCSYTRAMIICVTYRTCNSCHLQVDHIIYVPIYCVICTFSNGNLRRFGLDLDANLRHLWYQINYIRIIQIIDLLYWLPTNLKAYFLLKSEVPGLMTNVFGLNCKLPRIVFSSFCFKFD